MVKRPLSRVIVLCGWESDFVTHARPSHSRRFNDLRQAVSIPVTKSRIIQEQRMLSFLDRIQRHCGSRALQTEQSFQFLSILWTLMADVLKIVPLSLALSQSYCSHPNLTLELFHGGRKA